VDVWPADTQLQRAAVGAAPIPALTDSLQLGGGEPLPAAVEARMAGSLGHHFDLIGFLSGYQKKRTNHAYLRA
jgi:hypothetical protein